MDNKLASTNDGFDCPLCVDLDGTLVKTDTFVESCIALARQHPWHFARWPVWLLKGKACLKHEVATRTQLDPALLPYDDDFVGFLRHEKNRGRQLMLVTAANRLIAEKIADHLKLFDTVFASDGNKNLRGSEKARALSDKFGVGCFSYAGNDHCDLPVWEVARSAVTVNAAKSVTRKIPPHVPVEQQFPRNTWHLSVLLRALRPYQWVKNLLVLVPIITAGAFGELESWFKALLVLMAFCATASGLYLFNDMMDVNADREHPRKRTRPFASGELLLSTGLWLAPLLISIGFCFAIAGDAVIFILGYTIISLLYSLKIKQFPLVDVFALAALYSLRLFAGGEVTDHPVSFWLLAFSSFLFLSLALVKRVAELNANGISCRGYSPKDREILQLMGIAASFVSANVLALYVQSDTVQVQYANPRMLWGIVPLMLLWQCRIWLSTSRRGMYDDPIVFAAKDWVSWMAGLALVVVLALSFVRF